MSHSHLSLLAGAVNQETKGRTALAYISTVMFFFLCEYQHSCRVLGNNNKVVRTHIREKKGHTQRPRPHVSRCTDTANVCSCFRHLRWLAVAAHQVQALLNQLTMSVMNNLLTHDRGRTASSCMYIHTDTRTIRTQICVFVRIRMYSPVRKCRCIHLHYILFIIMHNY